MKQLLHVSYTKLVIYVFISIKSNCFFINLSVKLYVDFIKTYRIPKGTNTPCVFVFIFVGFLSSWIMNDNW